MYVYSTRHSLALKANSSFSARFARPFTLSPCFRPILAAMPRFPRSPLHKGRAAI